MANVGLPEILQKEVCRATYSGDLAELVLLSLVASQDAARDRYEVHGVYANQEEDTVLIQIAERECLGIVFDVKISFRTWL